MCSLIMTLLNFYGGLHPHHCGFPGNAETYRVGCADLHEVAPKSPLKPQPVASAVKPAFPMAQQLFFFPAHTWLGLPAQLAVLV